MKNDSIAWVGMDTDTNNNHVAALVNKVVLETFTRRPRNEIETSR